MLGAVLLVMVCSYSARGQETVTAQVEVGSQPKENRAKQHPAKEREITGVGNGEVVVWLKPVDAPAQRGNDPPPKRQKLVQFHKTFEPHLLVVEVGSVVDFPNRDPFFHNVFSLFEGKRFDLGLYEAGTTRNVSFDRAGISFIFCNIHAEMSAIVIALDTPYYGISNRKGEVVIPRVPPGQYTLKTWAETALPENLNALTREVTISDDSASLGVLEITAGMVSTAHKNKFGMDYEPPAPNSPGYQQP
jgi:plastocyanin